MANTSNIKNSERRKPGTTRCNEVDLPERIRKRAYELFEARGCQPGYELDDWLQAEREVKHHFGL